MKKIIGSLMVAVSTIALSAQANANMDLKPYVGMDYNHTRANAKLSRPYFNSGSVNVGVNYNKNFGTELFYQYSDEYAKGDGEGRDKVSFQAYGLDLFGYLPIGCDQKLSMLGTAGIGEYRFDGKYVPGISTIRDHGYGYRLGAGAQFDISNNVAVRAIYRHIMFDKVAGLDHANEYSVGVKYSF